MQVKIHDSYRKVVSVVDSDLLGKTFTEDIKQIKINPAFFQGEEKDADEVIELLIEMEKEDATFNIVGKESIECALKAGVIEKSGIIYIEGIPIALILL